MLSSTNKLLASANKPGCRWVGYICFQSNSARSNMEQSTSGKPVQNPHGIVTARIAVDGEQSPQSQANVGNAIERHARAEEERSITAAERERIAKATAARRKWPRPPGFFWRLVTHFALFLIVHAYCLLAYSCQMLIPMVRKYRKLAANRIHGISSVSVP
jgi:hypothetical protein